MTMGNFAYGHIIPILVVFTRKGPPDQPYLHAPCFGPKHGTLLGWLIFGHGDQKQPDCPAPHLRTIGL